MVHKYDNYEPQTTEKKSLRREVMPEPQYFDDDPYNPIPLDTPVYHVLHCQEECPPPMRRSCSEPQNSSFLSTIKNCVINLTAPYKCKSAPQKTRRRDGSISLHDVICSLKKDVQMIARQQDCNAVNSADPFFTLSAMMCKLNKLEECIIKLMRDEKNTQRRKDMLIVAKAIRKALVKEYLCDEKSLKEKKKKICRILESLKIFEGQIICSGRRSKFQCCMDCASPKLCCKPMDCPCPPKCPEPVCPPKCPPPKCCPPKCPPKCPPPKCCPPKCPKPPVCPPDPCAGPCGDPCADPCPDPCDPSADPCPDPCNPCPDPCDPCADPCPDPCADPCDDPCCDDKTEMEVTSMNFKYLKTNYGQTEAEDELQCSTETSMSLIKNGKKCDVCSNPELRQKVEKSSHLWLASAKELIKSFDCQ